MPKGNNLQFSLSKEYIDRLTEIAQKGESLSVCAKRLLLELLDGDKEIKSDRLSQLEERVSKIEGENIGDNLGDSQERLTALEQKLETVLADRDNLLNRIANQQNQHLEEIKQIYKDANDLNVKLEQENYSLQKFNDDAQRENDFLEARLKGVPITDPQYVTQLEIRLQALERQLQVANKPNAKSESIDGLSSQQLAEILGCDRTTLSRWKQKGNPRLDEWESRDNKWYRISH